MPMNILRALRVASFLSVALASSIAGAQSQPAVRGSPVQRANALCGQADEEQHDDHLTEARAHLEQALAALGTLDTVPARRARVRCAETLAWVLSTQGDQRAAWTRIREAWSAARNLPAAVWAGNEPPLFELTRQVWSGARCAEGLDASQLEEAEVVTLQSLARFNTPAVAACLTAVRQRLRQEHGGTCQVISALPEGVAAFTPGAAGWTRVDAQTGVGGDGESLYVARVAGATTRYLRCHTGLSEAQLEQASGQWVLPNAVLAVTARIRPCGEDMDARRCPPETVAYMFDADGLLLGHYTLQRSSQSDRGPFAQPFGAVTTAAPFRAEGDGIRAGNRLLRVSQGALVNAQ